jgi:hypothetical protein
VGARDVAGGRVGVARRELLLGRVAVPAAGGAVGVEGLVEPAGTGTGGRADVLGH